MDPVADYRQFCEDLEQEISRIRAIHLADLVCQPGCSDCCTAFSLLPIEAALLREAIVGLPSDVKSQLTKAEQSSRCPLLLDGLCAVYQARPTICRSQGLPLAYIDEERGIIDVSACPLNFADASLLPPEQFLFMDPFNASLAAINCAWCEENKVPAGVRIPIRSLISPKPGCNQGGS